MEESENGEGPKTKVVGSLFKDYAQRATVHGIQQTVGANRYSGQRFIWLFLILLLAILLSTVLYMQMSDYYDYPTVINMAELPLEEEDFPAITFCDPPPLSPFSFISSDDDNDDDSVKVFNLIRSGPLAPHSCLHMRSAADAEIGQCLLDNSQDQVRMKFTKCGWNKLKSKEACDENLFPTTTTEGSCFSLNSSRNGTNREGQLLTFNVILELDSSISGIGQRDGIQIALHPSKEYPFPDVKDAHFIPANSSCIIKFDKVTRYSLGSPYKDLLGGTCLPDEDANQRTLYRYPYYTQTACRRECLVNYTVQQCGCKYYLDKGCEDICPPSQTWFCLENSGQDFYSNATFPCDCPARCTRVEYEASVSCAPLTSISASAPMIHLTFLQASALKMEVQQKAVYSTETILGSIGGQIGLFMGFSIVSMVEILEVVVIMIFALVSPKDAPEETKEEANTSKPKQDYDDHSV